MLELPYKIPNRAINNLKESLIHIETSDDSIIELKIVMQGNDMNLRELGYFLIFIDKLYGRIQPEGIHSYSRLREKQLKISELKSGSIEAIISGEVASVGAEISALYFFVFVLPIVLERTSKAYRNYEEGRLFRVNRQRIKNELEKEERIKNISERHIDELISLIRYLVLLDKKIIPPVKRFYEKYIRNIIIQIKDNKNDKKKFK